MVLVLTIEKYSYEDKGLRCSRHNAARITTLFREKYGYRHVQCYNYKRNKIDVEECGVLWKVNGEDVFEWMRKKRKELDNAKYDDIDGIIFYISAHGLDNYVAASDDARIKIAEICKIFSNKNCNKKHRGKPRILIVESCRGKKQCEHHGKESFGTMNGDKDGDKGKEGKGKVWTETSDSFIFYATTTGYVAIHDHESGSRYTNIFCDEFAAKKDEGWTLSLMGNHINEKLIAKHKIQTSETYSTLTKPVILVPNNC